MPTLPSKPALAVWAAFAVAVLLIGARFLRDGQEGQAPAGAAVAGVTGQEGETVADAAGDGLGGVERVDGGPLDGAGAAAGDPGVADPADGALVVDVKGAVRRPGVYRLPVGARAYDAVRRAGGLTRRADRIGINLAARVVDGGEVVVPTRGRGGAAAGGAVGISAAGGGSGASAAGSSSGPGGGGDHPLALDINTATAAELEQLNGVGPALAAAIVAYREEHGGFKSIDELDNVSGIGAARLAAIRAQLGQ